MPRSPPGKGGVGKTTATANIGVALAAAGYRVVCIDGDIGLRNLDVVMGLENRIVYDLVDVVEGRCKLRQAMIKDKRLPDLLPDPGRPDARQDGRLAAGHGAPGQGPARPTSTGS